MKHRIDPTIDCVFKSLLGTERNRNLLVYFLNSVLQRPPKNRIVNVVLKNPNSEKRFKAEKATVVDVLARDGRGSLYQVEVQLLPHGGLAERMLYTWSNIYTASIKQGQDFEDLAPVVSIWLLKDSLFIGRPSFHHHFQVQDRKSGLILSDHFSIHVLEMEKWHEPASPMDLDLWLKFFVEGVKLDCDHPPAVLDTKEFRQAMQVLREFSEQEKKYDLYRRRMLALSEHRTLVNSAKRSQAERDAALVKADIAEAKADAAQEEVRKLKKLLRQAGVK